MKAFEIVHPSTIEEAIESLDPDDPTIRPISGGTGLMLMMKSSLFAPTRLVSLNRVEDNYRGISEGPDRALTIGALATLRSVEMSKLTPVVVRKTLKTLSNVRVRNVATIGGSLAHGDPHMDLPPVMVVLGASVTIKGPDGVRKICLEDFYKGYYETSLALNELICSLHVPAQVGKRVGYKKITTRSADDWPSLGVAVSLTGKGNAVGEAKVVVGAAAETPTRLVETESLLTGAIINDNVLKQMGDTAADEAELISDPQGSTAYKRELLRVTLKRVVKTLIQEEGS